MVKAAALAALWLGAAGAAGGATAAPPHIIFALTDDLGWNFPGYHHGEQGVLHTPTLDALAAGGVRLESSYMYKYCSPSRGSLLTGRYPWPAAVGAQSATEAFRQVMLQQPPASTTTTTAASSSLFFQLGESTVAARRATVRSCMQASGGAPCPGALGSTLKVMKAHTRREATAWFSDECGALKHRVATETAYLLAPPAGSENLSEVVDAQRDCAHATDALNKYLIKRDIGLAGINAMKDRIAGMSVTQRADEKQKCEELMALYKQEDMAVMALWGACDGRIAKLEEILAYAVTLKHAPPTPASDSSSLAAGSAAAGAAGATATAIAASRALYDALLGKEPRAFVCEPVPKECAEPTPMYDPATGGCVKCPDASPFWDSVRAECRRDEPPSTPSTPSSSPPGRGGTVGPKFPIIVPIPFRLGGDSACPQGMTRSAKGEPCACPEDAPVYFDGHCCPVGQLWKEMPGGGANNNTGMCTAPDVKVPCPEHLPFRNPENNMCECPPTQPHFVQNLFDKDGKPRGHGHCTTCKAPRNNYVPKGAVSPTLSCAASSLPISPVSGQQVEASTAAPSENLPVDPSAETTATVFLQRPKRGSRLRRRLLMDGSDDAATLADPQPASSTTQPVDNRGHPRGDQPPTGGTSTPTEDVPRR